MHEKEIEFCDKLKKSLLQRGDETETIDSGCNEAISCLIKACNKIKDKESSKILEKEISVLTRKMNEKKYYGEKIKKALCLIDEVKQCLEG